MVSAAGRRSSQRLERRSRLHDAYFYGHAMIKATFLMEQHIGHRAYYANLRRHIDRAQDVEPSWIEITYQNETSLWQHLPWLPAGARGTLIGREQTKQGMKNPANVLFFNTQVPAVLSGKPKRPYIIATDITPVQYDRMGAVYGHRADRQGWVRQAKQYFNRRILRGAATLLPWSSWAAESLVNDYGVEPGRVEVLPPGVDLEVWRPAHAREPEPFRILFVGGDFERKGGYDLLSAFQELPGSTSGRLELALVTRSPVPNTPGVKVYSHFSPNSPDLIRLYQSSHVFVLPSQAEAFGIAAVEASAVGLPVIAAKTGGLADIVVDGETGFQIKAGDRQQLKARLCQLMKDDALRIQMGHAGRSRAECNFDAAKNAARLVQIMAEVVRKG
jgi:glycosyltransferase involved in cell wall biosynthesis